MTAKARAVRMRQHSAARPANTQDGAPPDEAAQRELSAMLAIADALASLAADLWFAGKLDRLPREEELGDDE